MDLLKICLIFSLALFSIFFACFLLFRKESKSLKKWIIISFISIALVNIIEVSFYFPRFKDSIAERMPMWFYLKDVFQFLVLPTFYIYLVKCYDQPINVIKYLSPYLITGGVLIVYFSIEGSQEELKKVSCHQNIWSLRTNWIINVLYVFQVILYGILTWRFFYIKKPAGYPFKNWHSLLFFTLLSIEILFFIDQSLFFSVDYFHIQVFTHIIYKALALILLFTLFILELNLNFVSADLNGIRSKYYSSGLNEEKIKQLSSLFRDYFANKPFIECDFNQNKMAADLALPKAYISEVINKEYDGNFNEVINRLRIEEATELISQEPEISINQVFYEVGFNSKSVFYTAFKKFKHMTPTEYKKKVVFSKANS